MIDAYEEHRVLRGATTLSWDVAHHLYTRQFRGRVIIVAENPSTLLPAVRKQWQRVIAQVIKARALTLGVKQSEYLRQIHHMEAMNFSLDSSKTWDVLLTRMPDLSEMVPSCSTLYATTRSTGSHELKVMRQSVGPAGLIVVYRYLN